MREEDSRRPRIQPVKKQPSAVLEVDLHATELLDDLRGLSSGDILQYQLAKFNEVMQEQSKNKGQKIVFIHGKGTECSKKQFTMS